MNSNIIRANPNFHNQPRYDYALVKVHGQQCMFVQVLYIFRVTYEEVRHHLALVIPFNVPLNQQMPNRNPNRDRELRLTCVCPRPRESSIFINTDTIIRGALLAEDLSSRAAERLVVNFIDQDMWMWLKTVDLITDVDM